jgi:hypothetical protein
MSGVLSAERLSWSCIEVFGYVVEFVLRVAAEIFSLVQVLAQQAVCVLVDDALPRAMQMCEVDLQFGPLLQILMPSHLAGDRRARLLESGGYSRRTPTQHQLRLEQRMRLKRQLLIRLPHATLFLAEMLHLDFERGEPETQGLCAIVFSNRRMSLKEAKGRRSRVFVLSGFEINSC